MYKLTEENAVNLNRDIEKIVEQELFNLTEALAFYNENLIIKSAYINRIRDSITSQIEFVLYEVYLKEEE